MRLWAQGEKASSLVRGWATSERAAGHGLQPFLLGGGPSACPSGSAPHHPGALPDAGEVDACWCWKPRGGTSGELFTFTTFLSQENVPLLCKVGSPHALLTVPDPAALFMIRWHRTDTWWTNEILSPGSVTFDARLSLGGRPWSRLPPAASAWPAWLGGGVPPVDLSYIHVAHIGGCFLQPK